jgi:hypothetical protein
MLDEKAFFITINQGVTLSLQTYGMTVKKYDESSFYFLAKPEVFTKIP